QNCLCIGPPPHASAPLAAIDKGARLMTEWVSVGLMLFSLRLARSPDAPTRRSGRSGDLRPGTRSRPAAGLRTSLPYRRLPAPAGLLVLVGDGRVDPVPEPCLLSHNMWPRICFIFPNLRRARRDLGMTRMP